MIHDRDRQTDRQTRLCIASRGKNRQFLRTAAFVFFSWRSTHMWQSRKTLHKWKDNSVFDTPLAACTHLSSTVSQLFRLKLKIWKLRAVIDNQRIYYVPDIRVIHTSLFITTMTSRQKSSGFDFWLCVGLHAWPWCIYPLNFAPIPLSNLELFTIYEF